MLVPEVVVGRPMQRHFLLWLRRVNDSGGVWATVKKVPIHVYANRHKTTFERGQLRHPHRRKHFWQAGRCRHKSHNNICDELVLNISLLVFAELRVRLHAMNEPNAGER